MHFEAYVDEASGIRFVFKRDADAPEMLHIYARHLTTVNDAVETFFSGATSWNPRRRRFETFTPTHGVFWFWLKERTDVMIVTCFRNEVV